MEIVANKDGNSNIITSVSTDEIIIGDKSILETCIVSNDNLITKLSINSIKDLTSKHIEDLLSSNPELIIIGSGSDHMFPETFLLGPIAINNIGFEVMNNQSASRTYNVLLAEERHVACLLIIDNS